MAELEAGLKGAQDGVAADDADDLALGDDGNLAEFLLLHALENAGSGLVRRGGLDFIERLHHGLYGGVRPLVARNRRTRR